MSDSKSGEKKMRRLFAMSAPVAVLALGVLSPLSAIAQATVLKVIGSDSVPVPFAWVSVEGGAANITDEQGQVSLGAARRKTMAVEVRRIGYQPWLGKLDLPDSAAVLTVTLPRLTQTLASVVVSTAAAKRRLQLTGFYDRWLMRQKGALTAIFIGPEEIEKRHPTHTSDLLFGVNGVSMMSGSDGAMCARGSGGSCFMTVLVDGSVLRNTTLSCTLPSNSPLGRGAMAKASPGPDINQYIDAANVAAIEVYARGATMPASLQAADNSCGVIAIWTGSRR
jgi:hypothetical protein